jgi:hypothetical protein
MFCWEYVLISQANAFVAQQDSLWKCAKKAFCRSSKLYYFDTELLLHSKQRLRKCMMFYRRTDTCTLAIGSAINIALEEPVSILLLLIFVASKLYFNPESTELS